MSATGKNVDHRVPDYLLERLARGDLPAAQAAELRARLALDPDSAARLAALANSDAEILAAHPAADVAREVERRLSGVRRMDAARADAKARSIRNWWVAMALPATAAAALAVYARVAPDGTTGVATHFGPDPGEITRIKGDLRLLVFRKASPSPELLSKASVVHPGDVLQVGYAGAGGRENAAPTYGVIASVDARGEVTWHLPESPGAAVALQKGRTVLPSAYELDDSPGFERFVLVTSETPFSTDAAAGAVASPPKALPPGLAVIELHLRKEFRP